MRLENCIFTLFVLFVCVYSQSESCSLSLSREAKTILKDVFFPVLEYHSFNLSTKCIFHPSNDRYAFLLSKTTQLKKKKWRCELCQKIFSTQDFLDQHMISKHDGEIPEGPTICLGEFCDILRCQKNSEKIPYVTCRDDIMTKRKFYCESILSKCFPPEESDVAHKLNELFTKRFCEPLTCNGEVRNKMEEIVPIFEKNSTKWTGKSVMILILTGFLVVFFLNYYVVVCIWQRETKMKYDLRRLSSNRFAVKLDLWKKTKDY